VRIGVDGRASPQGLGIARFVDELARGLVSRGLEVVWLGDPQFAPAGCRTLPRWVAAAPYPWLDSPLGEVVASREQLDVLHFTANTGWIRTAAVPFVLTVHDLIFMDRGRTRPTTRQRLGHWYERRVVPRAARRAARIATPSSATARQVSEQLGVPPPDVVHNGVEPPPELPGTNAESPFVLAFGGRDPRKAAHLVLQGFRASRVTWKLCVLAGAGLPQGFEEKVRNEVETGRIELLPYQPQKKVWELLAQASVLVYPSTAEGFGLPVVEAMATGTPVLTGLSEATLEVGADAVLRINANDPVASIATNLRRLHDDSALRRDLAARGRRRVSAFQWSRAVDQYVDIYRAVIDG
jgi:glycosyltransferase involved in cell wall biosynthesis